MIELQSVSKSYNGVPALHPTDLTFEAGKTTVLIGPSGCGKSTILRTIVALIRPSGGTIRFEGQPITDQNSLSLRRRTGYVIQDGGLFPHLTAEQNVLLIARHFNRPPSDNHNPLNYRCCMTGC